MIRKVKGELCVECNDCGEKNYGGSQDDFREFVQEIKRAGWLVRKVGDEWQHICPPCQGDD
jgi:hypothetical protein